ncbi:hypothetical protein ACMFMG_008778 [Clarireedia jacksonii]
MSIPPLSIRNISTTPLELKLLERFESAEEKGGVNITRITKTFSGFMSNITSPTSPQLAQKSESFRHQDVSIPIASFETKTTDVQPKEKENLRLTFEINGERYRVDTPTPNQRSTVLTPLSHNPSYEFTAFSFLTIFSSAKLHSWMSNLKDETPLAALSIPGTHNSPTYHTALPSVRCQAVSVKEQLKNGIRFLDIRVQPSDPNNPNEEGLILVHSAFPVSLTGSKYFRRDLVQHINKFLDDNPTETIIMSVKREGVGKATDQQLSKILHKHYATNPARWFTENRIPTLGEARGKIVLIRRFMLDDSLKGENNGTGFCIDAESWPDNCADGICSSGEIRIQDFYEVAESVNIDKKIRYTTDQLERAAKAVAVLPGDMAAASAESAKQPLFVNFLSASNFWRANCWPDKIAAKVNPSVTEFLCRKHNDSTSTEHPDGASIGDGSTGIVVCDWVGIDGDWDLVRCILAMNAKLELREKDPTEQKDVPKEEEAPEKKDASEGNDTPVENVVSDEKCASETDAPEEDTPKKDAPKEDTPEKDTPEKETPEKNTSEKDTPEEDTLKKDTPEEDTSKKDAPKEDTPKEDTPKEDTPKEDTLKKDTPKEDTPKKDTPEKDTPEKETSEKNASEKDTPEEDTLKKDTPEEDTSKKDAPEEDTPKKDTPQKDTPEKDAPEEDSLEKDAVKTDFAKTDAPEEKAASA